MGLIDLAQRLDDEAARCCDGELADLLREAARSLRGRFGTCECGAKAEVAGRCRPCYQRRRRSAGEQEG